MRQPESTMPLVPFTPPPARGADSPLLHRALRLQVAVVRSLLDELEAQTVTGAWRPDTGHLAEEVGRLGGDLLRTSSALLDLATEEPA